MFEYFLFWGLTIIFEILILWVLFNWKFIDLKIAILFNLISYPVAFFLITQRVHFLVAEAIVIIIECLVFAILRRHSLDKLAHISIANFISAIFGLFL